MDKDDTWEPESRYKIVDDLLPLIRPISDFHTLAGNPRLGSIGAIARSLKKYGQRKPIVVRPDGEVVAGNHTLMGAKSLDWTHIAVVVVDEDREESLGFAIADNHTSELGTTDGQLLAEMIDEIREYDEALLEAASYSFEDIDRIMGDIISGLDDDILGSEPDKPEKEPTWHVFVNCDDEFQQAETIETLKSMGYDARPSAGKGKKNF